MEAQYNDKSTSTQVITTTTIVKDYDANTGNKLLNDYMILREIGRGVHGKVKLAQHMGTGELVVCIQHSYNHAIQKTPCLKLSVVGYQNSRQKEPQKTDGIQLITRSWTRRTRRRRRDRTSIQRKRAKDQKRNFNIGEMLPSKCSKIA